jgi:hypothetical protein
VRLGETVHDAGPDQPARKQRLATVTEPSFGSLYMRRELPE